MRGDKRMFLVRNLDIPAEEKEELEYEVTSDSRVIAGYTSPDYAFSGWEVPPRKPGVYRKLWLRIRKKTKVSGNEFAAAKPTRKGFYHGGDIADEIIALASLFLRTRFKLGPIVRLHGKPIMLSREKAVLDKAVIKDNVKLNELNESFELIKGLNADLHLDFIMAVRFYHRALLYIDENPVTAYLDLISAIETLSKYTDIGKPRVSWLSNNKALTEALKGINDKDLRAKIENAILDLDSVKGFIGKRFVRFILNYNTDDFWDPNRRDKDLPPRLYVEKKDLEKYLKKIYIIRSKYLHAGVAFPPFIFDPPQKNSELPLAETSWTLEKLWTEKDVIPLPHFFERLVRHVLINFLRAKQKDNG